MHIRFQVEYYTRWGEELYVCGNLPELGEGQAEDAAIMLYTGSGNWLLEIEVPDSQLPKSLQYRYYLGGSGPGLRSAEWGKYRQLKLSGIGKKRVLLQDSWRSTGQEENTWMSSAFTEVLMRPEKLPVAGKSSKNPALRFELLAPWLPENATIAILGDGEALGDWDTDKALRMDGSDYPIWKAELPSLPSETLAYKYILISKETGAILRWEAGDNRQLVAPQEYQNAFIRRQDHFFYYGHARWKGAGVAVPVFSLRSEQSMGAGSFCDLQLLADWAATSDLKLLQLLPVNDTTAYYSQRDSYPYSAISVYALHPLYLDLTELAAYLELPLSEECLSRGNALNNLEAVDYEKTIEFKMEKAKELFDLVGKSFMEKKEFLDFVAAQRSWLLPYAAFSKLRDHYKTADYKAWEKYAEFDRKKVEAFFKPKHAWYNEVSFYLFLQFHLDRQLREASDYARSKGIVLKGDLPIGIFRDSVDAWMYPELFHMDGQAGAPPDFFSTTGQNWSFPTYNWEAMQQDGYLWWRSRLRHLSRYFDVYRIDHILGFFRIWEIPLHAVQGTLGTFQPALPLSLDEIWSRDIPFEEIRMARPWITAQMVGDRLGEHTSWARATCLEDAGHGHFAFKKGWKSQQAVVEMMAKTKLGREQRQHITAALMSFHTEVLFLQDKSGQGWHPRIGFQTTESFRALPQDVQDRLSALHDEFFYERNESFWRDRAMEKLPALKGATDMLICGEDLGMVPAVVPEVMNSLDMLSLCIERMPHEASEGYVDLSHTPYLSVCSPSTHDMSPLRLWWEEEREEINRYYWDRLGGWGDVPAIADTEIITQILRQHLNSTSMFAIFALQDLFAMRDDWRIEDPAPERINNPGDPNHYWRYRMHRSLEELIADAEFSRELAAMVRQSGR